MSENNFNNNNKNDEINNIGIQFEYKYYNENESINVTYEDIDTCKYYLMKFLILEEEIL
jgi:hypothetical protein